MFINNWIVTLLILLASVFTIRGSHFEGGSISYKIVGTNGSQLIVRITQSYTYVYSKIYCNDTYIANQWNLVLSPYVDATATLNCIANCSTDGGYTPIPIASKCTDYSVGMGITVGQRTDDILLNNGSYFVVADQGSAFRTLNLPGSGGSTLNWSIAVVIDLRMRSDGTYNTPPKATMISPIYIPVGIQQTISIPTIDEDNDNVRCRYANGANECGSVCPPGSLPSGTSMSTNCSLTITGAAVGDWYAVAIQVEDFANSTTTTPYSSVPVQFLINVYAEPACTQRPYLYGPNLVGTCTGVQVGVPYTLTLYAENYCSSYGVTMVDIATQSFPVVIKTPIVQNTTTLWSISLTWTPTPFEIGSQVFCSVGVDSESVQTNQYCLSFTVGNGTLGTCPGVEITTTEEATTAALTTELPTTEAPTTAAQTTEVPTTELPTTPTTIVNTTVANNTSSNIIPAVAAVVFIPICCCCCCLLYCFIGPWRTNDVEERKKSVTTYTIEGAYMYKDHSLIDKKYSINNNDISYTTPLADTSHSTWYETSSIAKSILSKSFSSMDDDLNLSLPSMRRNISISLDTISKHDDQYKMKMHHNSFPFSSSIQENVQAIPNIKEKNIHGVKTMNYDLYPPLHLSTQTNTSSAPATIRSNIYRKNTQQSIDPLHFPSLSRPASATSLNTQLIGNVPQYNTRSAIIPWTKHPRWVLRLSQPKQVDTLSMTSNRSFSRERSHYKSTSSGKSTSTIPRYVVYEE